MTTLLAWLNHHKRIALGVGTFMTMLGLVALMILMQITRSSESRIGNALPAVSLPAVSVTSLSTPTGAATNTHTPIPTSTSTAIPVLYTVKSGDTLGQIARLYRISIEDILKSNPSLARPDFLVVGQKLVIPTAGTTGTPTGSATTTTLVPHSIFRGNLESNYPLQLSGARLTLHYQKNSFTERSNPSAISNDAGRALSLIERTLGVTYTGTLDVYIAGSLFIAPDQALRGQAFSPQRRFFVLFDGSGTPEERQYMLTHEMTHVVAWQTYGAPASVLLSEGLATFAGQPYLDEGGFINHKDFCRALYRAKRLPAVSVIENNAQEFLGHIRSMPNYMTAACFVGYLIELKGTGTFARVYKTSDYQSVYGAPLKQLQATFENSIDSNASSLPFDPARLVTIYAQIQDGYAKLFVNPNPDESAYRLLDRARIAVLTSKFNEADNLLTQFRSLTR